MSDTLTPEEAYYLKKWLDNHRHKAFITCEETCECWELQKKERNKIWHI